VALRDRILCEYLTPVQQNTVVAFLLFIIY